VNIICMSAAEWYSGTLIVYKNMPLEMNTPIDGSYTGIQIV